jgi:hypothetical protein
LSAYLHFLAALERLPRIDHRVMAGALGRCIPEFLRRHWITADDYLTHVMVPFLDSEQEVEVEIDANAAVIGKAVSARSRVLERPWVKLRCTPAVDTWLTELASLIASKRGTFHVTD